MIVEGVEFNSDRWHELRGQGVGASEVSGLFDLQSSTYGLSRWSLWQIKSGRMAAPVWDDVRAQAGRFLEPGILAMGAAIEGWSLATPGPYVVDDVEPRMRASLDGVITAITPKALAIVGADASGPGVVDAKNVDYLQWRDEWPEAPGDPNERIPPYRLQIQVQQQLGCTGFEWGCLAVLIGGNDPRFFYYRRSPAVIELIRERIAGLYGSIERGEEPPVDGSSMASRIVRQHTREVRGDTLNATVDAEFERIVKAREEAKAARDAGKAAYDAADNALRVRLGPYEAALTASYYVTGRADKNGNRRYSVRQRKD